MSLIIDASVALKWVLEEDGTSAAIALIGADQLAAPDLMPVECANVLTMKTRRGLIGATEAQAALRAILDTPVRIVPSAGHVADAQALALLLGQTAYDCLYLALAISEGAILVTADDAFARAVSAKPDLEKSIRRLGG